MLDWLADRFEDGVEAELRFENKWVRGAAQGRTPRSREGRRTVLDALRISEEITRKVWARRLAS